jgi:hypothetical protein
MLLFDTSPRAGTPHSVPDSRDEVLQIVFGRDVNYSQFKSVTLENSMYKAVIRVRERQIRAHGKYDHAIRDWILKSNNQDQVDVCIDGSAHRYVCDRATLVADSSSFKSVRLEYGDAYINQYTIYAHSPFIRIDYLKYDVPHDDGDWCNIVDIGTPGGISERYKAETKIYGQENWSRPLTYHEAPYWSIYYRADKDIYSTVDDSTAGSLNYKDFFIMTVSNPETGVGFGRIIPIYQHTNKGGVRILKLLWDTGFEPFISTGQEERRPVTSYVFLFQNGADAAIRAAQLFLDEHMPNH